MGHTVERDRLELEGIVVSSCKGIFQVEVADNYTINCTLSGKIRQNTVRILLGDRVIVEVSEYDTTRGRIIFRKK